MFYCRFCLSMAAMADRPRLVFFVMDVMHFQSNHLVSRLMVILGGAKTTTTAAGEKRVIM